MSQSNIVKLQQLFDKYIYSSLDEAHLIDIATKDNSIINDLTWEDILQYFPNKEDFYSSLTIYAETIILQNDKEGNIYSYPLLCRCNVIDDHHIQVKHEAIGLRLYLYRIPSAVIYNSYLKEILIKSFERYKMRGEVLYSILSKGYEFNCSPEEFKEIHGVNYINSMLKIRVLSPIESRVRELFDQGVIPYYLSISFIRSVIGKGNRIIRIQFEIEDNIVVLRQNRMRKDYMLFIMKEIKKLFPFDYPFIEEDLKPIDNKGIENIYHMIKNIDHDPDYHKLDTSTLVRFKLLQEYGIKIAMP